MTLTIYHLKTCDTCRKAIKALDTAGHNPTLVDVRADGIKKAEIERLASKLGWEALLNTRSTTWRRLDDDQKSDITEVKAVKLMSEHPTLIKRPVIDTGRNVTVGWKADVQSLYL